MAIRFTHTNLIAKDWRRLASFYEKIFGCTPVLPERDISGEWLEKATGVENAHITGVHLRLPGCGDEGPTLEVFSYDNLPERSEIRSNTPGFSHIAFIVDDVAAKAKEVFAEGGKPFGELTVRKIPGVGVLTFYYVMDPEGNIIELQKREAE
ncbi:MAG: VOC family protein [Deltaproteobacteria bacterium]|nr:VOC family protein [Deltaproteobacteria bacterium]